jgi:hypothetical protein
MANSSVRFSILASGALATLLLLAGACSSDDNKNQTPSNGVGGSANTGGAASDTGGAAADTGGASSDTGGAASDTGGAASDTGGAASATGGTSSPGTTTCTHDTSKNCYECPPTTNEQILTACSNAACLSFDNSGRGVPASLPAIP